MVVRFRLAPLVLAALLCAPSAAETQDFSQDVLQPDAFEDDPVGAGDTLDLHLVRPSEPRKGAGAEPDPDRAPPSPHVDVRDGKVLLAVPDVRAIEHRVHVQLEAGLARVDEVVRLDNGGRHSAEARYRLAVPQGAELAGFRVCIADRCRRGRVADGAERARAAYDAAVRARGESGDAPVPVGYADRVVDARGPAFVLWGAPVPTDGWLELRVAWVAPAPTHGGTTRMTLPARGRDPRAAPASITVQAEDMLSPTVDGSPAERTPVRVAPWRAAEVLAMHSTAAAPEVHLWHVPCGEGACVRARVAAGPVRGRPRELLLMIDASPSTLGPARGRIAPTVRTLLDTAPAGSRARAVAFGSRAHVLAGSPQPAGRFPVDRVAAAVDLRLGAATRFEAAWPVLREWAGESRRAGRSPEVVIVGDGGLTRGKASDAALEQARELGVPVHAVNVGERPTRSALRDATRRTGGRLVWAATEADRARGEASAPALAERLTALFAPVVAEGVVLQLGRRRVRLGDLHAGEALVHEAPSPGGRMVLAVQGMRTRARPAPPPFREALARRLARGHRQQPPAPLAALAPADLRDVPSRACGDHAPARRPSGVSSDDDPVALAASRACSPERPELPSLDPPDDPLAGKGIPAASVRTMLRQRVIPVARRCLRRERRGRTDHAIRAVYVFRLAEREVVGARVEGDLSASLRRCLLGAVDRLQVPPFEGVVAVRYPIYTERAPDPPRIELEAPAAEEVGQVVEGQPSEPLR